jgi:tRNA(fMet)-specific endonuclease VapC
MILDSTFLVDVLRGEEDVADLVRDLDATGTAFVSAVTVMDLAEGIRLTDAAADERTAVEELLTDINELPCDRECAMLAGRLSADLLSGGGRIDETDAMIGATARVYDYPVVTRNVDHFERIDGLEIPS